MSYAIFTFIFLVFLALTYGCYILTRDNPRPTDVTLTYIEPDLDEGEPDETD